MTYTKIILTAITISIFWLTCSNTNTQNNKQQNDAANDKSLYIVTTTGMLQDAVRNIVQDKATVDALMGPGVDPHLYKATQSDLNKLTKADVIVYNGLYLEGKMEEILKKISKQKTVIAAAEGIPIERLIPLVENDNSHALYDPHVWFDVTLWAALIKNLTRELQATDSLNAKFYSTNTKAYLQQLQNLHAEAVSKFAEIPTQQRLLITSHDAFHYMGKAYNIEVKGLQGISTITEFGLKDVTDMVDLLIKRNIKAVFIESSVPQKPLEAVIEGCKQKGHTVSIGGTLYSDAMGKQGTTEGTYIGMVQHNINTIVKALK